MFFRLLLLFTIVPVLELYLLIRIGSAIGAASTIALVILTGVLGAYLARNQGFAVLLSIRQRLDRGEFPADEMIDGLCILVAAVVLVTPGIVTDLLGFLLLFPPTRSVLRKALVRYLHVHVANVQVRPEAVRPAENTETTFIDPDEER
jgi:UPF0716 protein FxsA